ncbi:MAG: 4-hydroxythreonine-4-phosphate dehydrogenase PdxA, partial [Gammaproteobacteria bacterium]
MRDHSEARIALTAGEPAGIGPDLCLLLAQQASTSKITVIADKTLLQQRAQQLELDIKLIDFDPQTTAKPTPVSTLNVYHVPLKVPCICQQSDPANAAYVIETLNIAVQGCLQGQFQALVTAPINKSVIQQGGFDFSGHTEFLATITNTPQVVMMLVTEQLRVALATTHLPLSEVATAINREHLTTTLKILHQDLKKYFAIDKPNIYICGLNPHAGENGCLGNEEIDTITPVIQQLQKTGMSLHGPMPADTVFTEKYLQHADAVLAMYHDQGLPVLKYAGFGQAVNITLGLPIIRTSVDHGTAFDLAG